MRIAQTINKNKLNKIFLILFLILITFPLVYNNTRFWLEIILNKVNNTYVIPEGYPAGQWNIAFMKQASFSKSIFFSNPYARTETPEIWFFLPVNIAGKIIQIFNADINIVYVVFSIISYIVIFIGGVFVF